jgi:hypothetical protein
LSFFESCHPCIEFISNSCLFKKLTLKSLHILDPQSGRTACCSRLWLFALEVRRDTTA